MAPKYGVGNVGEALFDDFPTAGAVSFKMLRDCFAEDLDPFFGHVGLSLLKRPL